MPGNPGLQVFLLLAPALGVLSVLPAQSEGCLGLGLALLLPGRCAGSAAGCARTARARLLRSKITARELGLHCAPLPPPPCAPRHCAGGRAPRGWRSHSAPGSQGSSLATTGLVTRGTGTRDGKTMLVDLGPTGLGAASRESRFSPLVLSPLSCSFFIYPPFFSFFFLG